MGNGDKAIERRNAVGNYYLCQVKKAKNPYYIESISANIYTIEELCYYLKENIYLIDKTLINEKLCDWIRDELGLKKLYKRLYEQLEREESIGNFILPIFKEIGYLSHQEFKNLQEKIVQIEIQPDDIRRKLKADYLLEYKMYINAISEYSKILQERNPGNMGIQFYASVLNNMASAYAQLFLFEEAADCLWQSYGIVKSKETYKRYLNCLVICLPPARCDEKFKELKVPDELRQKIQARVKEISISAKESARAGELAEIPMEEIVESLKKEYHKSTCS